MTWNWAPRVVAIYCIHPNVLLFCIYFSSQKVMLIAHGKQIECIKSRKLKYWEFQVCCLSHLFGSWRWKEFLVLSSKYHLFIGSTEVSHFCSSKSQPQKYNFQVELFKSIWWLCIGPLLQSQHPSGYEGQSNYNTVVIHSLTVTQPQ